MNKILLTIFKKKIIHSIKKKSAKGRKIDSLNKTNQRRKKVKEIDNTELKKKIFKKKLSKKEGNFAPIFMFSIL